ncbi:MAG: condensation domain-containing protein, partial [Methylocystis sp.]
SSFVVLERLPLTANGKLDVRALPDPEIVGEEDYRAPETPTQQLLADLYAELTGATRVGLDDSFFALGGDSITAIRLVSRVRQAGYSLSVKDIFARPIVGMLAEGLPRLEGETVAIAAPDPGYVALTPIERQFLSGGGRLDRFHQAVAVEAPLGITRERVEEALYRLMAHHDALRLRVVWDDAGERSRDDLDGETFDAQESRASLGSGEIVSPDTEILAGGVTSSRSSLWLDPLGERVSLERLDVSGLSLEAGEEKISALLRDLPGRLDPQNGRMVVGAWVERAAGERALLLLVIHHLSVDGVSWRILLEDLEHATSGRILPARTHSIRDWSDYLVKEASSPKRRDELATWKAVVSGAGLLPCDAQLSKEKNVIGAMRHYESSLASVEMERLFASTSVYRTGIDDLLLTALGLALYGWRRDYYGLRGATSSAPLLVDLEGHGREVGESGLDLSRTVGWFTSVYPVRLDFDGIDLAAAFEGEAAAGYALRQMKEELRRTSDRGLGYGVLRWLNDETRGEVSRLPQAEIAFNYLGRFEGTRQQANPSDAHDANWRLLRSGLVGGEDDPGRQRFYLIDVNAVLDGSGSLRINWSYHPDAHAEASIQDLARRYHDALVALTKHCQEAPLDQRLTPSDFPLAKQTGLDQSLLDHLIGDPTFEEVVPLAPLQWGLAYESWAQGVDRRQDPYHVQLAFELKGRLEVGRLKRAFEGLVDRHRILRLRAPFEALDRGLGVIGKREVDWRVERADGRSIEERLREDHDAAFDLARGPLIRVCVIEKDRDRHIILLSNHHALLDGWSTPLLFADLWSLYRGEVLPAAYDWRDHLVWLSKQDRAEALAYWQDHFAGDAGSGSLTFTKTSSNETSSPEAGVGEHSVSLSAEISTRIERYARQQGLTASAVYQGAFILLLARLSGRSEMTIGVTRSGRSSDRPGIERAVGLYIQTLPLRREMGLGEDLSEWLRDLQEEQARQEEYGHLSLTEIQRCAGMMGSESLFEALFVYENYPVATEAGRIASDIEITDFKARDATHYALSLMVIPGSSTKLRFTYDGLKLDRETVEAIGARLTRVLSEISQSRADTRIGEITLVDHEERTQVVSTFNDTQREIPTTTLPELFSAQVAKTPDAIALIFGDEEVSYRELDARANQLARYLIAEKIGPEDIVAIALDRSIEMVVSLLGVLKNGAAYLPLDPEYPVERLAFMLRDSNARRLITTSEIYERLLGEPGQNSIDGAPHQGADVRSSVFSSSVGFGADAFPGALLLDDEIIQTELATLSSASISDNERVQPLTPDNLAYVIYTSGTSGKPKGVGVSNENITRLVQWMAITYDISSKTRMLARTSINFDASIWEIFTPLIKGGLIAIASAHEQGDATLILSLIEKNNIRDIQTPPSLLPLFSRIAFKGKRIYFGGEPVLHSHIRELLSAGVERIVNLYGPTEATVQAVTCIVSDDKAVGLAPPIGSPIWNTQIYILDTSLSPLPIGSVGE